MPVSEYFIMLYLGLAILENLFSCKLRHLYALMNITNMKLMYYLWNTFISQQRKQKLNKNKENENNISNKKQKLK